MTTRHAPFAAFAITLLATPLAALPQNLKPGKDVLQAATLALPIDPAAQLQRRFEGGYADIAGHAEILRDLGLTPGQVRERWPLYTVDRLSDHRGSLAVFSANLVDRRGVHSLQTDDVPKGSTRNMPEVQLSFDTERGVRYLLDVVVYSGGQAFALVVGDTRTDGVPVFGHLLVIAPGTGHREKVRALPLGDAEFAARQFTLNFVSVTPIREK